MRESYEQRKKEGPVNEAIKAVLDAIAIRDKYKKGAYYQKWLDFLPTLNGLWNKPNQDLKAVYYQKWLDFLPTLNELWNNSNQDLQLFLRNVQAQYVYKSQYISNSAGVDSSFLSVIDAKGCSCIDSAFFLIACARTFSQQQIFFVQTSSHVWIAIKNGESNTVQHLETTLRFDNTTNSGFIRWRSTDEIIKLTGAYEKIDSVQEIAAIYIGNLMRNANNLSENGIISYQESKYRQDSLYQILEEYKLIDKITLPSTLNDLARHHLYNENITEALIFFKKSFTFSESKKTLVKSVLLHILENMHSICTNYKFWSNKYEVNARKDILLEVKELAYEINQKIQFLNDREYASKIRCLYSKIVHASESLLEGLMCPEKCGHINSVCGN